MGPQVAAGIGILGEPSTELALEPLLRAANSESNPKVVLSAYCALRYIGSEIANEFERSPAFEQVRLKDRDGCIDIADEHWNYWKEVKPVDETGV